MKAYFILVIGLLLFCRLHAGAGYHAYLLSRVYDCSRFVRNSENTGSCGAGAYIPHYQIPKGNVFCRMEDKLTKVSKVWIKIGVD